MEANLILPPVEIMATVAAEIAEQAQQTNDRPTLNAANKAIAELHNGCAPIPTIGGFLVESRTRGGIGQAPGRERTALRHD